MPGIKETIEFIKQAFGDTLDKSYKLKYLDSIRVMEILPDKVSEEVKLAALLHDIPEDTRYKIDDLREMGYSELTLGIVEKLTHLKQEKPYHLFINNIVEDVCRASRKDTKTLEDAINEGAILVKYADICHNTTDERMQGLKPAKQDKLWKKYTAAKIMLRMAVKTLGYEDFDPQRTAAKLR